MAVLTIDHLVCGAINWDITMFVKKLPKEGEEVRVSKIIQVPGGKGANIAVASARLLGRDKVGVFGALGSDTIADEQVKILRKEGIVTSLIQKMKNLSSGQAYILVDQSGRNSIMTFKKANDMLTDESASKVIDAIGRCKLVTVVDPPFAVVKKIIESAARKGKITVWAPGLLSSMVVKSKKLLKNVDYLVLNEPESFDVSGFSDPVPACRMIAKTTKVATIVTSGKKGCIFCRENEAVSIPAADLEKMGLRIRNTTGAGDAFIGTFSAMKILGKDDVESLRLASLAGSIKVTRNETRGSPSLNELVKFSRKNQLG